MVMPEPVSRRKRWHLARRDDRLRDKTEDTIQAEQVSPWSDPEKPVKMQAGSQDAAFQLSENVAPAEERIWLPLKHGSQSITTNLKAADLVTEPTSSSTSRPEVHGKRTDTLAIALGITFGFIFLAVICLIALLCFRRRRKHGSFIYQDNIGAVSVDSFVPATNLGSAALQTDVSTASSSPERQPPQLARALETITEKSSGGTSPASVSARTSPVYAMGIITASSTGGSMPSLPAAKGEAYYPPLPAPHQLSSLGRRHSSELAYVPNDPFYDSNTAIFELHAQQQREQILQQQQQQQHHHQPQHISIRSRGSLSGNPSTALAPLREYPEHTGFREPRNPLPQDPREQALYNYRNTPDMQQPNHAPNGQYRRPRIVSLPASPPNQQPYRTSPDMSLLRQSPDNRGGAYRNSPETGSFRTSPDMSSYNPSPELASASYRHSPETSTPPRRSFEEQQHRRSSPPELHHMAFVHRSNSLKHPVPKRAARLQQHGPNWPWPHNHPASMGLPPTSNPFATVPYGLPQQQQQQQQLPRSIPHPPTNPAIRPPFDSSHVLARPSATAGPNLTPAARFRADLMRYKHLHAQHQLQQRKQNHRRWTSEPHLLASNMRVMQNHPALQRKPVPLPRMTPIPPLEEVKLPAFWWEEESEDQHLKRQSQRRSVALAALTGEDLPVAAAAAAPETGRPSGQQVVGAGGGGTEHTVLEQSVEEFFLSKLEGRDRPLRRFSFESRPVVDFEIDAIR